MEMTFWTLIITGAVTAVVHTAAGPDHYLPFIVLAKKCRWNMLQTLAWTFLCGLAHVGTAIILAILFFTLGRIITENRLLVFDDYRSTISASILFALGFVYLLWGVRHAIRNRPHSHEHTHIEQNDKHEHLHTHHRGHLHVHGSGIAPWVLFIALALGPCEVLIPILSAASVVGSGCLILTAAVFSTLTIATMMLSVCLGLYGIEMLNFRFIDRYSHIFGGTTIMFCGIMTLFFGW